jgi:soluble lytic murein transglycosylase-like protein
MELQRRYGYVAIDSPFLEHDDRFHPLDQQADQIVGLPEGGPWSGLAYSERSRSHIQVLMIVVLFLSAVAFWVVFRPNAAVFASGQNSAPADGGLSLFTEAVSSVGNAGLISAENGAAGALESNDRVIEAVGTLSLLFTPEVRYWEPQILRWAAEYEVDPNIVATIMQIESCGNPGAASYAGAQGLFQVMPFHFQPGEDMLDPDTNAMRGLAFFREQMRYTGGDVFLSFAGYNGGYAASGGVYGNWAAETQRYYYWAKGIYLDASSGANQSATLSEWLAAGGGGGCQAAATALGI